MALDCGCSPRRPALDVDNRGVFCSGPLLDRVQRSDMFPDSKHFVDMSCIYSPADTMADYELFSNCARNDGSLEFLQMFVEKHFNEPGSELQPWTPPDWKAQPSFLNKVSDPEIKQFALEVNELWKQLGRRVSDDVKENPDFYSIIYIPKPFIIPSTECREYRYWDSFWIVRGLLQCGMHQTARGMIENYLVLVQQYGYVPACGRIYCTERTHPPLLIMMVKAYVEVTRDEQFAIQSLPLLETEYETFVSKHSVEVKGRTMYQYRVSSSPGPRPEAYREDLAAAEHLQDEAARNELFTELKSASESGQDFSSRWFVAQGGSSQAARKDTKPSAIVPVELNAIIFRSGKILAEFNRKAGNAKKGDEYQDRSCALVKAIRDVLWNDEAGIWLDYDVVNNKSRNYFCCTNFAPLWARAFPLIDTDKVSKAVMEYIKTNKLDEQYGGLPHTMDKKAGEKWDHPNVFPPMMFLVVEGLDNLGTRASKAMSRRWAHRWVKVNYAVFKKESTMFEKYHCEAFFSSGGARPNTPVGYGWTNAVIIEFLCKYGREISVASEENSCTCRSDKKASYIITSEANMEGQSSKGLEKKSCECATSTTGGTPGKVSKSTAAMGAQSAANCTPSGQQQKDEDCSCSIAQKSQAQGSDAEGNCSCGAGGGGRSQPQQEQQDGLTAQSSWRSQQSSGGAARMLDKETQHDPNCPFAADQDERKQQQQKQQDPDCPCGEEKRKQQQQKQNNPDCPCAEEKRKQQQQKQHDPDCPCAEEKRKQQQKKQNNPDCPCAEERRKQQQQKQHDPDCPCAEERRKQQQQKQHDPDCPCAADRDKGKQQSSKPVSCVSSKQELQQDDDSDCDCAAEAKKKIEKLQKQTACYQKQQEMQQERQQQDQQRQREAQQQDCSPSTKPKPQDCSQEMKKQAQSGCACDVDEEQQRQEQQAQLTGHYSPLHDKTEDDWKEAEDTDPCDCGNDDCPDDPQDNYGNTTGKSTPRSMQQQKGGPKAQAPVATAVCPHCGGIVMPTPSASSHSVATNKSAAAKDDCVCSGGGQQMKGMTSIGLQSGTSKIGRSECNPPSQPEAGCNCCGGGQQTKGMASPGAQSGRSGANHRSQPEADCTCSGGGQQTKGMASPGAQSGRSGANQRSQPEANCDCSGGATPCGQQTKGNASPGAQSGRSGANQRSQPEADCDCSGAPSPGSPQAKGNASPGAQSGRSGANQRSQPEADCDCSGAPSPGSPQSKGMASPGQQSGRSGANQRSQPEANCDCSGAASPGSPQSKSMSSKTGGKSGAGGGACGPCQAQTTAEYAPGHGPTPKFNKQFPLADPVDSDDDFPPKEAKKEEKKEEEAKD